MPICRILHIWKHKRNFPIWCSVSLIFHIWFLIFHPDISHHEPHDQKTKRWPCSIHSLSVKLSKLIDTTLSNSKVWLRMSSNQRRHSDTVFYQLSFVDQINWCWKKYKIVQEWGSALYRRVNFAEQKFKTMKLIVETLAWGKISFIKGAPLLESIALQMYELVKQC